MPIGSSAEPGLDEQVDAVLAASRVLVAVSAQSMARLDDVVTPIQMRTLVILASRGPLRATELATALDVHPSNATRVCGKLVATGLLDRRENPDDRRTLVLSLRPKGKRVVAAIGRRRASAVAKVLGSVPVDRRAQVAAAMQEFARAGGEARDSDLWAMG